MYFQIYGYVSWKWHVHILLFPLAISTWRKIYAQFEPSRVDESAIAMDAQQCICLIATVFFLDQIKRFRFIPYIGFVTFDLFILIRLRVVFFFTEITMNNVGHGSQFIDTMWQVRFVRISINKWYVIIIIKKKYLRGKTCTWIIY